MQSETHILEINDLSVGFADSDGTTNVVNGFSLSIDAAETVALVGESGSGKSVTCLSVMGLLPEAGRVTGGTIRFQGRDLEQLSRAERRSLRGSSISMIFQEPMTSLNPVFRVGSQIAEAVQVHSEGSRDDARRTALELLDLVRIPEAKDRLRNYPHELSGGMRQRVMIAMALASSPRLLIADEPTTALDVTVQAQILDLLGELQSELGMALLFVTHDLGVVAGIADRICVMYAGQGVEYGSVLDVFSGPLMPYTAGLLKSVPSLMGADYDDRLLTIPGQSPLPGSVVSGCAFGPRCEYALDSCTADSVPLKASGERHVRCLRSDELSL